MNRTPPDHGASMFAGAFGPIVKLTGTPGGMTVRNTPKPIGGGAQQSIPLNDAQPINSLYQPTGG